MIYCTYDNYMYMKYDYDMMKDKSHAESMTENVNIFIAHDYLTHIISATNSAIYYIITGRQFLP